VNQNIAALQAARSLRTGAAYDGAGLIATGTLGSVDLETQAALREWLVANRAAIDYTNRAPASGDFDQRGADEKWDALMEFAGDLVDDARFYREFADQTPDSAGDAWVVIYTADRTALLGRLDAALAVADAGLSAAYGALSAADRDVLLSYGFVDEVSAADLRRSLESARQSLAADIAAVSGGDYRRVYYRETQIEQERELRAASLEYSAINRRLSEDRSERAELERYRDELTTERDALNPGADAARIAQLNNQLTDINDRIATLATNIAALEGQIAAPEARMRAAQNHLQRDRAARQHRAAVDPAGRGSGLRTRESGGSGLSAAAAGRSERDLTTPRRETTADQVKAVIGFYRTDAAGAILRDGAGEALISQEFLDLGYTDPNMDLADALSGSQTGPNLERWSQRLIDWIRQAEASGQADPATQPDPEVTAAVRQLERGIADVMAARAFIENRAVDPATLEAQAAADAQFYGAATGKLALLIQFESDLANAIYQAEQNRRRSGGSGARVFREIREPFYVSTVRRLRRGRRTRQHRRRESTGPGGRTAPPCGTPARKPQRARRGRSGRPVRGVHGAVSGGLCGERRSAAGGRGGFYRRVSAAGRPERDDRDCGSSPTRTFARTCGPG
jgi:flagellar biosynthesis chaperone FliJ